MGNVCHKVYLHALRPDALLHSPAILLAKLFKPLAALPEHRPFGVFHAGHRFPEVHVLYLPLQHRNIPRNDELRINEQHQKYALYGYQQCSEKHRRSRSGKRILHTNQEQQRIHQRCRAEYRVYEHNALRAPAAYKFPRKQVDNEAAHALYRSPQEIQQAVNTAAAGENAVPAPRAKTQPHIKPQHRHARRGKSANDHHVYPVRPGVGAEVGEIIRHEERRRAKRRDQDRRKGYLIKHRQHGMKRSFTVGALADDAAEINEYRRPEHKQADIRYQNDPHIVNAVFIPKRQRRALAFAKSDTYLGNARVRQCSRNNGVVIHYRPCVRNAVFVKAAVFHVNAAVEVQLVEHRFVYRIICHGIADISRHTVYSQRQILNGGVSLCFFGNKRQRNPFAAVNIVNRLIKSVRGFYCRRKRQQGQNAVIIGQIYEPFLVIN